MRLVLGNNNYNIMYCFNKTELFMYYIVCLTYYFNEYEPLLNYYHLIEKNIVDDLTN